MRMMTMKIRFMMVQIKTFLSQSRQNLLRRTKINPRTALINSKPELEKQQLMSTQRMDQLALGILRISKTDTQKEKFH